MLAGLAEAGGGRVDVNDFFLHEAMAQVGGDSTGRGQHSHACTRPWRRWVGTALGGDSTPTHARGHGAGGRAGGRVGGREGGRVLAQAGGRAAGLVGGVLA
jgi:hypothetical protein